MINARSGRWAGHPKTHNCMINGQVREVGGGKQTVDDLPRREVLDASWTFPEVAG
jgi:hypothetical protein